MASNAVEITLQASDKASETVNKVSTSFNKLNKEIALTDKAIQAADASMKLLSASADFAKVKFIESGIAVTGFGNAIFGASAGAVLSLGGIAKAIVQVRELAQSPVAQPFVSLIAQQAEAATKKVAPLSKVLREVAGVAGNFGQGVKEGLGFEKLITPEKVKAQIGKSFDGVGKSLYSGVENAFSGFYDRSAKQQEYLQGQVEDYKILQETANKVGIQNDLKAAERQSQSLKKGTDEYYEAEKRKYQLTRDLQKVSIQEQLALQRKPKYQYDEKDLLPEEGGEIGKYLQRLDKEIASQLSGGILDAALGDGLIKDLLASPALKSFGPEFSKKLFQGSAFGAVDSIVSGLNSSLGQSGLVNFADELAKATTGSDLKSAAKQIDATLANTVIDGAFAHAIGEGVPQNAAKQIVKSPAIRGILQNLRRVLPEGRSVKL
jgi:hypothetical protein